MAKPYGLANQKLCYIQMLLTIEKSGEQDKESSIKRMVGEHGPGDMALFEKRQLWVQFSVSMTPGKIRYHGPSAAKCIS